MSTKQTTKVHEGHWSITGRGASKVYAMLIGGQANPGDRFTAKSQAQVVTTGTLVSIIAKVDNGTRWTFTKDAKTAEERAHDRALNAQRTAAYWASDKGVATAERIAARAEKKTTEQVTEQVTEQAPTAAPTMAPTMDLGALIAANITAGMDPVTAAQVAMATLAAVAPTTAAPTTSATTAATTTAPKARTPRASTKTPSAATTKARQSCQACGKQDTLTSHRGSPELMVCGTCLTSDTDTVRTRAIRQALKTK